MGANRKHLAMTITPNKWELDVQGYLNTCNITDATPRKQIRDFSAGVNDLGLWNSMVCWPLAVFAKLWQWHHGVFAGWAGDF
jgi:hypothetical protein